MGDSSTVLKLFSIVLGTASFTAQATAPQGETSCAPRGSAITCTLAAPGPGYDAYPLFAQAIGACQQQPVVPCTLQLLPGTYNLLSGIVLPSNTSLIGMGDRSTVVLNRASFVMGPILTLGLSVDQNPNGDLTTSNILVENVDLNGQRLAPQLAKPFNNVNILINGCQSCVVQNIISENARLSSIDVHAGAAIKVSGSLIRMNGESKTGTFLRSDGISVHSIMGGEISYNSFLNNTDVNLIIGGGSTNLNVIGNVVDTMTPLQPGQDFPGAGAGFMFDTEPNWSTYCALGKTSCNDFSSVSFQGNVEACGTGCMYGVAVGAHLNDNWFDRDANGNPIANLPVENLKVPATNVFHRVTIDYTVGTSFVAPTLRVFTCVPGMLAGATVYPFGNSCFAQYNYTPTWTPKPGSCKVSSLSLPTTYNPAQCSPCQGSAYKGSTAPPGAVADGTMCDAGADAW